MEQCAVSGSLVQVPTDPDSSPLEQGPRWVAYCWDERESRRLGGGLTWRGPCCTSTVRHGGGAVPMARAYLRAAARVVRWTLVAVVLIAAVVGLLFITRGTAVHRVRAVGADGAPLSPSEPAFPLSVALLAGTPIVPGNRVELALNGDGTFPRLWADLRAARRSIDLFRMASVRRCSCGGIPPATPGEPVGSAEPLARARHRS